MFTFHGHVFEYMYVHHEHLRAQRSQKRTPSDPLKLCCRRSWASMWVLGMDPLHEQGALLTMEAFLQPQYLTSLKQCYFLYFEYWLNNSKRVIDSFLKTYFLCIFVCTSWNIGAPCVHRALQKPEEPLGPPEKKEKKNKNGVTEVVKLFEIGDGNWTTSSVRAVRTLKCWAISPAPNHRPFKVFFLVTRLSWFA